MVDRLEKAGLIERRPDAENRHLSRKRRPWPRRSAKRVTDDVVLFCMSLID